MTPVKAVLLDLFGTVIAYGDVAAGTEAAFRGIHDVLVGLGCAMPYDEFAPRWDRDFVTPLAPEDDTAETVFMGKMLRLFRDLGLPRDETAAREAVQRCLMGWDRHIALPDDAIPTIQALGERYRVALVSNFDHPPYAHDLLARHGLTGLFHHIVISGDIRIDKPDPRIFYHALEAVDCAPHEAVFVGDSLGADIAGSWAVGCRSVLIDMAGNHPDHAGERIGTLSELLDLL
jgi:HAD superfamily hydrolase (TIGR01549 family)